jgi:dipeptidyl aminopeptidase/acylaminoacyl peptidase
MQKSARSLAIALVIVILPLASPAQSSLDIKQLLSAPFPTLLTAAPAKNRVAWVFTAEGRRNLWVAGPSGAEPSRPLTHFTEDDGIDIGDLAWSPDAESIAYVRGADFEAPSKPAANPALLPGGVEQNIFLVSYAGGEPRKIAQGRAPIFNAKGDALIYLSGGQLWTIALAPDAKPTQLLHTRGSIGSLRLSPDGKLLAFVSDRGEHAFIGVYSFAANTLTYLDPSADGDGEPAWSPDSKSIAYIRIPSGNDDGEFVPARSWPLPWSVRIADVATGKSRELWKAPAGRGSAFSFISAKNQLLWASGSHIVFPWEADGWLHLYSIPTTGGDATLLTPGAFEVEDVSLSPDRATLVYSSNQAVSDPLDTDRRHLWSLSLAASTTPKPTALTTGAGIEVAPVIATDNHSVAALHSDARNPMRPAWISDAGAPTDIAPQSMPKDFPSARLVVPQQVLYTAADGMTIHAQLFLPPASSGPRHPALVFFHGGSRRQMLLGWHYMDYYSHSYAMNQYLASLGYVVLVANYRSGIGYGLNFREALNYGAAGASEFNDVLGAGLYLRGRADVDPARIGVWGGSYGGYLTALALARASNLFAAGVDFHGVHDWNIELGNWNTAYDPKADPNAARLARESSPIASVDTWRSPVLLIHGDDDRNVQFSQTPQLAAALRKRNVEVEELIFPDEVHFLLLHKNWLAAYAAETDFFNRKLMHPAPPKP